MSAKRYLITGLLTTRTPLAIRSGLTWKDVCEEDASFRGKDKTWNDETDVSLITRDVNKSPYLPGSALKGVIGAFLKQHQQNNDWKMLLGEDSNSDDSGRGGCVIFYDAFLDKNFQYKMSSANLPWWNEETLTYIEPSVSIDRRTKTAGDHLLRFSEVVPPGVNFKLEILVDSNDQKNVESILMALKGFNLLDRDNPIQLGSETSNGWGQFHWNLKEIKCLTPTTIDNPEVVTMDSPDIPRRISSNVSISMDLGLKFSGPFLVNDPSKEEKRRGTEDSENQNRNAQNGIDHVPRKTVDGKPLLPAGSFRGAVRSQLEKIIRTLVQNAAVSPHPFNSTQSGNATTSLPVNSPLRKLLGLTDQKSRLSVSDFIGKENQSTQRQEMVAIDRWTGGGLDGAKYNVDYFESPTLTGNIRVTLENNEEGMGILGLLAMLIRDICEGDVTFGFGASKGFGQCTASITACHVAGINDAWKDKIPETLKDNTNENFDALIMSSSNTDTFNSFLNDCLAICRKNIIEWSEPEDETQVKELTNV